VYLSGYTVRIRCDAGPPEQSLENCSIVRRHAGPSVLSAQVCFQCSGIHLDIEHSSVVPDHRVVRGRYSLPNQRESGRRRRRGQHGTLTSLARKVPTASPRRSAKRSFARPDPVPPNERSKTSTAVRPQRETGFGWRRRRRRVERRSAALRCEFMPGGGHLGERAAAARARAAGGRTHEADISCEC